MEGREAGRGVDLHVMARAPPAGQVVDVAALESVRVRVREAA